MLRSLGPWGCLLNPAAPGIGIRLVCRSFIPDGGFSFAQNCQRHSSEAPTRSRPPGSRLRAPRAARKRRPGRLQTAHAQERERGRSTPATFRICMAKKSRLRSLRQPGQRTHMTDPSGPDVATGLHSRSSFSFPFGTDQVSSIRFRAFFAAINPRTLAPTIRGIETSCPFPQSRSR